MSLIMRLQSCRPIHDEEFGFDGMAVDFPGSQPSVAQCMLVRSVVMIEPLSRAFFAKNNHLSTVLGWPHKLVFLCVSVAFSCCVLVSAGLNWSQLVSLVSTGLTGRSVETRPVSRLESKLHHFPVVATLQYLIE